MKFFSKYRGVKKLDSVHNVDIPAVLEVHELLD